MEADCPNTRFLVNDGIRPSFTVRYKDLNRYIEQFEGEQREVLEILVNIDKAKEFGVLDMKVTSTMN